MSLSIERNIFDKLKTALDAIRWNDADNKTQRLKNVDKYRGQFDPEKAAELQPSQFPAVFIQFTRENFLDLTFGIQMYDLNVILHFGYESYADTELWVFQVKQVIHSAMQGYQPEDETCSMLKRTAETQEDIHEQIQDFQQTYKCTVKDFSADRRPSTPSSAPITLGITVDIQTEPE
jgi:hypothetical protein